MSEELKKMNVMVGGRSLPLKVPHEEVAKMQQIVSNINSRLQQYQHTYQLDDMRDSLAMLLLTYAVDLNKFQSGHASDEDYSELELTRIDELLDQYLQSS